MGARGGKQKHALTDVFFAGGKGGIRTRGGGLSPRTHLAGEPIQPLWHLPNIQLSNCAFQAEPPAKHHLKLPAEGVGFEPT